MSFLYAKERNMNIYPRISNTVSKLGIGIGTVNLPAVMTCRADAPCRKGCYACKGNFMYSNVKSSLQKNLDAFVEDADRFFSILDNQLNTESGSSVLGFQHAQFHSPNSLHTL